MENAPVLAAIAVLLLISGAPFLSSYENMVVEPITSIHHPVNVSFTSNGIIISYRYNDSTTKLGRLDTNGTIRPYASSFVGVQEVYLAETTGLGRFIKGDLFLCSGDSIYRMAHGAGTVHLFATPSPGSTVEFISFDNVGSWGGLLYALTGDGGVWALNATGATTLVTNLGSNLMPEGLVVAPSRFGSYSGDLLVSMENSHNLVAIPRNTTGIHITLATFPDQAPERVQEVIPNSDLLVAKYDQGTLVRIPAKNFTGYAGLVLLITEGENGQAGSINILKASGPNITVTTLLNDSSSPHFEGAAFIPAGYLQVSNTTTTSAGQKPGPNSSVNLVYFVSVLALFALAVSVLLVNSYLKKKP